METKVLKITGMSCDHCKAAVTDALRRVPGIESVAVNLEQGIATVTCDPTRVDPSAMVDAVDEAGYEAQMAGG